MKVEKKARPALSNLFSNIFYHQKNLLNGYFYFFLSVLTKPSHLPPLKKGPWLLCPLKINHWGDDGWALSGWALLAELPGPPPCEIGEMRQHPVWTLKMQICFFLERGVLLPGGSSQKWSVNVIRLHFGATRENSKFSTVKCDFFILATSAPCWPPVLHKSALWIPSILPSISLEKGEGKISRTSFLRTCKIGGRKRA